MEETVYSFYCQDCKEYNNKYEEDLTKGIWDETGEEAIMLNTICYRCKRLLKASHMIKRKDV